MTAFQRAAARTGNMVWSPEENGATDLSRLRDSPFLDTNSPMSTASVLDAETVISKQRRTSTGSRSKFGLAMLGGLGIVNTTSATNIGARQRPGGRVATHDPLGSVQVSGSIVNHLDARGPQSTAVLCSKGDFHA